MSYALAGMMETMVETMTTAKMQGDWPAPLHVDEPEVRRTQVEDDIVCDGRRTNSYRAVVAVHTSIVSACRQGVSVGISATAQRQVMLTSHPKRYPRSWCASSLTGHFPYPLPIA